MIGTIYVGKHLTWQQHQGTHMGLGNVPEVRISQDRETAHASFSYPEAASYILQKDAYSEWPAKSWLVQTVPHQDSPPPPSPTETEIEGGSENGHLCREN